MIPKSSPGEFIGERRLVTAPKLPLLSVALKISKPPIPGCPLLEKYNLPDGDTYGYISSEVVFTDPPRFAGAPQLDEAASHLTIKISFPPTVPGISEEKYITDPSEDKAGWPVL